jgi:hypothetical protein
MDSSGRFTALHLPSYLLVDILQVVFVILSVRLPLVSRQGYFEEDRS